jgi:iron complex outermembrane recepter protein
MMRRRPGELSVRFFRVNNVPLAFLWLSLMLSFSAMAQRDHTLQGVVTTETGAPLSGATVKLTPGDRMVVSNGDGRFTFMNLPAGTHMIQVFFTGFTPKLDTVLVPFTDGLYRVVLARGFETLHEVIVYGNHPHEVKRESPLDVEVISGDYIRQHMSGSLMQSLKRLPGVGSMDIGSGHSKPVIRGLGFNRVMVVEHGIRHQGQQWGADHGLEIDQYAAEDIEVVKGPMSLMYGSDAIGGVIVIRHRPVPLAGTSGGTMDIHAAGNNGLLVASAMTYTRGERFHFSLRATGSVFGDYRVPGDHVDIYSYRVPLRDHRLRNTAGRESSFHLGGGYENGRLRNRIYLSHIQSRGGFFAHAHGLEPRNVDTLLHDRSAYDIQMPHHQVTHTKVVNHLVYAGASYTLDIKTGYQQNNRKEHSIYNQHGFTPAIFPDSLPFSSTLDRSFLLDQLSTIIRLSRSYDNGIALHAGVAGEWQQNRIDGRSFIIPAYRQQQLGAFLYGRHQLSKSQLLHLGVRYDFSRLRTDGYHDWFPTPVPTGNDTVSMHLLRAPAITHHFNSVTWSVGYNHNLEHIAFRVNLGKGFRIPLAQELVANGVNFHQFSYQVGNPDLKPEVSWQLDMGVTWQHPRYAISVTPFVNYFPNYIYLNPTPEFDRVYGNGQQVFRFSESEVFRYGGEVHAHYQIVSWLKVGAMAEYVRSVQLTGEKSGFTLPFSPPLASIWHLKATGKAKGRFHKPWAGVDLHLVAKQKLVVPPEETTPGYALVNVSTGVTIHFGRTTSMLTLAVRNLLNTRYMSHNSYYRLINLPEPGRNVTLNLTIPFTMPNL